MRKYIACETAPGQRGKPGRRSSVLPFATYLEKCWWAGEHNGVRLWQQIKKQGFKGDIEAVQRFIRSWRTVAVGTISCPVSSRGLSPRHTSKLLLSPKRAKTETERDYLETLGEISPEVKKLQTLGISFQQMIREKRDDLFDDCLAQVKTSGIKELQNWANGLLTDEEAVRQALSSPWSNGQTEGQVNRLKTIKRQMYGRANFDLFRARVLHGN